MGTVKRMWRAGILIHSYLFIATLTRTFCHQFSSPSSPATTYQSLPSHPIDKPTIPHTDEASHLIAPSINYAYVFSYYDDLSPTPQYQPPTPPFAYLAVLMIMSTVMLLMTFYNRLLHAKGLTWAMRNQIRSISISTHLDRLRTALRGILFDDDSFIQPVKSKQSQHPVKRSVHSRHK